MKEKPLCDDCSNLCFVNDRPNGPAKIACEAYGFLDRDQLPTEHCERFAAESC